MNSRFNQILVALFVLVTFVQCDDTPLTAPSQDEETPTTEPSVELNQPVLIAPEDGSEHADSVVLDWEPRPKAESYEVHVSNSDDFSTLLVKEIVDSSQFKTADLPGESSIHWKVRSVAQGEHSPWSNTRTFLTDNSFSGEGEGEGEDEGNGDDEEKQPPASSNEGFVTADNGDFFLNGEVFRFAGTNAYHLPNYEKMDPSVVNRAMDGFQEAGVKVVRTWGFYDGDPQYSNDITLQPQAGQYSEENLRHLDKLIAKGKEHGVKFILALTNYWHELGGMPQYNAWDGNPNGGMQHFMNDEDTQRWFKDYIEMLLERTNTVTGVKYKNEPAIFAWEIMNEGRNPDSSNPQELADWYQEIAQYIKSIDSNHMVSTGEEGFDYGTPDEYNSGEYTNTYVLRAKEGTSYLANTSVPEIDYGTAHWYPTRWVGSNESDVKQTQTAFMKDHAKIAEDLGKPFVIGEYGYEGDGNSTQLSIYKHLWDFNESNKVDGSLLWQLAADWVKCYEYRGNICYPGGREDIDLYNSLKDHIDFMDNSK